MPYLALSGDEIVRPYEVTNDSPISCRRCNEPMSVVPSHDSGGSFVAAYFRHKVSSDCPGESPEHMRMKSIAYSKLEKEYPNSEITTETVRQNTDGTYREADILVHFPSSRHPFGKGIAVEVQYKNKSKDIDATEEDYFDLGYSVLWLYERHYSNGKNVELGHIRPIWPKAIPHKEKPVTTLADFGEKESRDSIEIDVKFPTQFYESVAPVVQEAFESARKEKMERIEELSFEDLEKRRDRFDPYHKVWLSDYSNPVKTSLELVDTRLGEYALQLSKGKSGEHPDGVKIPVTRDNVGKLSTISEAIESSKSRTHNDKEWIEIVTYHPETRESDIKAKIALKSNPSNENIVIQIQRNQVNKMPEQIDATFVPTTSRKREISTFFKEIGSRINGGG